MTAPATRWFLAEGATGPFFDEFVLLANPSSSDARVRVTYLLTDGRTFRKDMVARANARTNIWVDYETFDGYRPCRSPMPRCRRPWSRSTPCRSSSNGRCGGRAMRPPGTRPTTRAAPPRRARCGRWPKARSAGRARVTRLFEDGTSLMRD